MAMCPWPWYSSAPIIFKKSSRSGGGWSIKLLIFGIAASTDRKEAGPLELSDIMQLSFRPPSPSQAHLDEIENVDHWDKKKLVKEGISWGVMFWNSSLLKYSDSNTPSSPISWPQWLSHGWGVQFYNMQSCYRHLDWDPPEWKTLSNNYWKRPLDFFFIYLILLSCFSALYLHRKISWSLPWPSVDERRKTVLRSVWILHFLSHKRFCVEGDGKHSTLYLLWKYKH